LPDYGNYLSHLRHPTVLCQVAVAYIPGWLILDIIHPNLMDRASAVYKVQKP